jgi:hypothetical protein
MEKDRASTGFSEPLFLIKEEFRIEETPLREIGSPTFQYIPPVLVNGKPKEFNFEK